MEGEAKVALLHKQPAFVEKQEQPKCMLMSARGLNSYDTSRSYVISST